MGVDTLLWSMGVLLRPSGPKKIKQLTSGEGTLIWHLRVTESLVWNLLEKIHNTAIHFAHNFYPNDVLNKNSID